jgi:hypothetical protein
MTEKPLTHAELIQAARKWLQKQYAGSAVYGHTSCPVVISELVTVSISGEIPDAIGFSPSKGISILIECKTSRSDFFADQKKPFRQSVLSTLGMGDQRWYLAEKGIIPIESLPSKWGLLEYDNRNIKVSKRCELFENKNWKNEMHLLLSALRRLKVEPDKCIGIRVYEKEFSGNKKKAAIDIDVNGEAV